jgi:hypothetical protein
MASRLGRGNEQDSIARRNSLDWWVGVPVNRRCFRFISSIAKSKPGVNYWGLAGEQVGSAATTGIYTPFCQRLRLILIAPQRFYAVGGTRAWHAERGAERKHQAPSQLMRVNNPNNPVISFGRYSCNVRFWPLLLIYFQSHLLDTLLTAYLLN